jgi:hypothetical protein
MDRKSMKCESSILFRVRPSLPRFLHKLHHEALPAFVQISLSALKFKLAACSNGLGSFKSLLNLKRFSPLIEII